MPEYTSNFNLPRPLSNENVSRAAHNDLVEAIDINVGNALSAHLADNTQHPLVTDTLDNNDGRPDGTILFYIGA
ncbi:MAG: hypothetical protein APF84_05855 [Gracilibacter sp. BRH_c7a]|nr:MAG: hypothetical protein APF84_05855 [Gracilibacter sp. BRH_c7a]